MPVEKRHRAYDIIRNEHRAIAAVIHCLEEILKEVREDELEPSFELFELIVRYLSEFPDQFHHPKEDDFLFPALASRDASVGEEIDQLRQEHEDGVRLTAALVTKLRAWQAGVPGGQAAFDKAAREYIAFQWDHIRREETTILPRALELLGERDWAEIGAAFEENEDPIFGANPQAAFNGLFRKIVATAPAPWGLGGRHERRRPAYRSSLRVGRH